MIGTFVGLTSACVGCIGKRASRFAVRQGCRELVLEDGRVSERRGFKRSSSSIRVRSHALRFIAPDVDLKISGSDKDELSLAQRVARTSRTCRGSFCIPLNGAWSHTVFLFALGTFLFSTPSGGCCLILDKCLLLLVLLFSSPTTTNKYYYNNHNYTTSTINTTTTTTTSNTHTLLWPRYTHIPLPIDSSSQQALLKRSASPPPQGQRDFPKDKHDCADQHNDHKDKDHRDDGHIGHKHNHRVCFCLVGVLSCWSLHGVVLFTSWSCIFFLEWCFLLEWSFCLGV